MLGWSSTEIKVKVPQGALSGGVSVTVNGIKSNELNFKVISYIISLTPTSGKWVIFVTVKGMGFGPSQGNSTVVFGDISATDYTSWMDTELKLSA